MKESQWRTKLIQMWRKRTDKGFIWAHDAKFKSGFPDLYTIANGLACHYELKVRDREPKTYAEAIATVEPIQLATLREIAGNAGNARILILLSDKRVVLVNINANELHVYQDYEFNFCWMKERFLS